MRIGAVNVFAVNEGVIKLAVNKRKLLDACT